MHRRIAIAGVVGLMAGIVGLAEPAVAATAHPTQGAHIGVAASERVFTPRADTYVDAHNPYENFDIGPLVVAATPWRRVAYLKFSVEGVLGNVMRARLRLHTLDVSFAASNSGGTVRRVANTSWQEAMTYYVNAPSLGTALGRVGPVQRNHWYEIDVTPAVVGNGLVSFGVSSASANSVYYDSRELGANSPVLVVESS